MRSRISPTSSSMSSRRRATSLRICKCRIPAPPLQSQHIGRFIWINPIGFFFLILVTHPHIVTSAQIISAAGSSSDATAGSLGAGKRMHQRAATKTRSRANPLMMSGFSCELPSATVILIYFAPICGLFWSFFYFGIRTNLNNSPEAVALLEFSRGSCTFWQISTTCGLACAQDCNPSREGECVHGMAVGLYTQPTHLCLASFLKSATSRGR